MKISDLDLETKRIVVIAHAILQYPTEHNFKRLEGAIHDFDVKHHDERAINLIRALQIDLTNAAVEKAMEDDDAIPRDWNTSTILGSIYAFAF